MNHEPKSRSQLKREDDARQDLAKQLMELPPPLLDRIPCEPEIKKAVRFAAGLKQHGARRRELLHVAALLRGQETEPLARLVAELRGDPSGIVPTKQDTGDTENAAEPLSDLRSWAERTADRLLEDEKKAIASLRDANPEIEISRLRQLVRNLRKNPPPSASRLPAQPEKEALGAVKSKNRHAKARRVLIGYLLELEGESESD